MENIEEIDINKVDNNKSSVSKVPKFFRFKKDGVDYGRLNLFITILGTTLVIISFFVILMLFDEIIIRPIKNILTILSPFIIAIVIAYILQPSYNKLVAKGKSPVKASVRVTIYFALIFILIVVALITIISYKLAPELYISGSELFIRADSAVIAPLLNRMGFDYLIEKPFDLEVLTGGVSRIASLTGSFLVKSIIVISSVIYLLPSFKVFKKSLKKAMPKKVRDGGSDLLDIVTNSFTSYISGAMKIAKMIGLGYAIALTGIAVVSTFLNIALNGQYENFIFNVSSVSDIFFVAITIIALSAIGMVTNLIPYIGPIIGGIPIVILTFITEGATDSIPWFTISTLVLVVIIQQFESSVLQPTIMGNISSLHPVFILVGLTFFGAIFGVLGMIVSTPILLMIRNTLIYFDKKYDIF